MRSHIIWYKTRSSSEQINMLREVLRGIDVEIGEQVSTIRSEQIPSQLAAGLRSCGTVVIIGGMEQMREEDNIIFIIAKCLSLQLELESFSRSRYIYDTLRGIRLPSFETAVLFPSASGGPEGVVVSKYTQTLILLPRLTWENMDILASMREYLPAVVGYTPEQTVEEMEREQELAELENEHSEAAIAARHNAGKTAIVPDEELSPAQLRNWFAGLAGTDYAEETNRAPAARPDDDKRRYEATGGIPWDPVALPEAQKPQHKRFIPHDSDYIGETDGTLSWRRKQRITPILRAVSMLVILAVIIITVAVGLGNYQSGIIEKPVVYQSELAAMYDEYVGNGMLPAGFPEGALPKFAELYSINENVRGYISIPGTGLSQPIVMSDPAAPEFNASYSFYGSYDSRGTLYFDPSIDISIGSRSPNLVVYGNNNADGSMFAELKNYQSADYLAAHQLITLDTLYETSQWVVFSVCLVSGDTINEFNYANTRFYGQYDRQIHLYNLYIRSMFYTSTEVFPYEDMITLITNDDSFAGAKLLVCARRVRHEEDLSYVGSGIVKNDDVLMPDLWYMANHISERPNVPMLEIPTEDDSDVYTTPFGYTTTTKAATEATEAATTVATTAATSADTAPTQPGEPEEGSEDPNAVPDENWIENEFGGVSGSDTAAPPTAEAVETTTTEAPNPTTAPPASKVPAMKITSNGKVISGTAPEVLAMIAEAEIGGDCNIEAIKAQVVASYTFYLYSGGSAKAPSFPTKPATQKCKEAAEAVAGIYMSANGATPYTPYFATSAGKTAYNKDINGTDLSYLAAVDCSVDESVKDYKVVKEVSSGEVAKKVKQKKGIDLTVISNKNNWFDITERDENGLYVKQVKVGNQSYKGTTLHLSILGYTCLRSPCFWIEYDSSRDVFVFTSLGYGTGVGMSQTGAIAYAAQGKNYVWILQHFYTGIELKSK